MRVRDVVPALFVACLPATLHGQILRGRVLDAATGEPLAASDIRLLTGTDSVVEQVVADADGRFRVKAPWAGDWRVGLARIGYRPAVLGPITLGEGVVLDVEVRLAVEAVPLDALTVTAEPRVAALENVGFYDRRRGGFGRFVDRLQIEDQPSATRMTDLFRRMAGVRVLYDSRTNREYVILRGGIQASLRQAFCEPKIYLDGLQMYDLDWRELHPGDIDGLEVFRSTAELPPQYGGADATCGVILVWTRRGD